MTSPPRSETRETTSSILTYSRVSSRETRCYCFCSAGRRWLWNGGCGTAVVWFSGLLFISRNYHQQPTE
ncbi:hypothetical protein QVD17_11225 [Tagetes erecta]|uniref:Uncharacterized protein n=1 Tax=Tagetes erecta TaxID=13708 RepID=A0AAD8KXI0_TARER|nr:hypothetical protein QVD17_11225 [Tagetes erecta]